MAIHVPLNALDHLPPPNYAHAVLYLSLKASPEGTFRVLQKGLHRTFVQLPWLSGKVHRQAADTPGCLEIRHDLDLQDGACRQLKFNELATSLTWEDLRESAFPPAAFEDEALSWAPFLPDLKDGTDVLVAQANFLRGGCILAMALCHAACDGTGQGAILQLWAKNCREVQLQATPQTIMPLEMSDREILERSWQSEGTKRPADQILPRTWRLLGLEAPVEVLKTAPLAQPASPPGEMKPYIFYIPPARLATLRETCSTEAGHSTISVNDAISALIWRALLKSRTMVSEVTATNAAARLDLPFDVRPYLSTTLPPNYLGNCTMVNQVVLSHAELVAPSTSIGVVARTIREAVGEITTASLLDAYDLARLLRGKGTGVTLENLHVDGNGLMITSLLAVPIEEVSFGDALFGRDGKPESVRLLMGAISKVFRYCILLPRKRHGGVEFMANMFEKEMDLLMEDEEFGQYAMHVA